MDNVLIRSEPCGECGAEVIWTQNAWTADGMTHAAYRCVNGHVIDPSLTRQCPACGLHDTVLLGVVEGRQQFRCARCGETFTSPR